MEDYYPEKPVLVEKKGKTRLDVTVFTMVLFIGSFIFFFQESIWFVLSLLLVLAIHELGHFLFMKKFKYLNVRMFFVPFMGAFVQGHKEKYSQKESFWVVFAGPIPGILIGLACFFTAISLKSPEMLTISFLFILLNISNLLPLDPLDGGQLFRLFVQKNEDLFQLIFSLISSVVLIGVGYFIQGYILMAFGFLMSFRVRSLQKSYLIRREMTKEGLNFRISYAELSNEDYSKIKKYVLENNRALSKFIHLNGQDDDLELLIAKEVKSILAPALIKDVSFLGKIALLIFWILALFGPIVYFIFTDFDLSWYYEAIKSWG